MADKTVNSKCSPLGLFNTMFQVGLIGFGGGNALIPVLYQKTVEEQKLLTDEEYEEDVMVASITPGALPVEIAGGIGSRLLGWKGALIGAYGMALPGVVLTLAFLLLFKLLNEAILRQIEFVSVGIYAFISVLLVSYVKGTFHNRSVESKEFGGERVYKFCIACMVFALTCGKNLYRIIGADRTPLFGLATIDIFILAFFLIFTNTEKRNIFKNILSVVLGVFYIILKAQGIPLKSDIGLDILYGVMVVLAAIGCMTSIRRKRPVGLADSKNKRIKDITALIVIVVFVLIFASIMTGDSLNFAMKGALSSVISFGGGDAYLTVADGMFVDSGMISENDFYGSIVTVVNILPGSILCKTLAGIGFYLGNESVGTVVGGIVVAVLGFSVSVFASCGIFSLIHMFYGSVSDVPAFVMVRNWIRPIVSGLMLTVILSLVYQTKKLGSGIAAWGYIGVMAALAVLGNILHRKKKSNTVIAAMLALGGLIICNILNLVGLK